MDKILTIIISASVIMMAAVSMMFMTSNELGDLGEATGDEANCEFQVQQYCDGSVQMTELDQACLDQAQQRCADEEEVEQEIAQRADIPVTE